MPEEVTATEEQTEQTTPVTTEDVTNKEEFALPEGHWATDDSYYAGMDDETKVAAQKLAARFDDPAKALAAHLSAHQLRGQSIRLPKADATPEEKAEIYRKIFTKMGCPENAESYEMPKAEGLPEGFKLSGEKVTQATEFAHKYGLNQEAFDAAMDLHLKMAFGLLQEVEAEKAHIAEEKKKLQEGEWDQAKSTLKTEWGADYEKRFAKGQEWAKAKLADKLGWARFCYELYLKEIAEGKGFEGSGFGQPVSTVFDSHEGE